MKVDTVAWLRTHLNRRNSVRLKPQTTIAFSLVLFTLLMFEFSCTTPLQWGTIPPSADDLGVQAWLSDISLLKNEILKHPKLVADKTAQQVFIQEIEALEHTLESADNLIGSLADTAIPGIQKALAAVGDGHTRINASPSELFPVALRFFLDSRFVSEGASAPLEHWDLRIAAINQSQTEYLGSIVTRIGPFTMKEAIQHLAPYLSIEAALSKENEPYLHEHALRNEILEAFMNPYLMRHLTMADHNGLTLTVVREGVEEQVIVPLSPRQDVQWVRVLDSIPSIPFTRSHPDKSWWYDHVPGHSSSLYLRYDDCDKAAWPFFQEVLSQLPDRGSVEEGVDHLIVDLRFNAGGNSMPGYRFAQGLAKKKVSETSGGVIILVSGTTFSSAMQNAADIIKACGGKNQNTGAALLVGEPLTEPLRHYGEVKRFSLPASGLIIGRSSKLWTYDTTTGLFPERGVLEPSAEHLLWPDFDDYQNGIDTVFEHVLDLIP